MAAKRPPDFSGGFGYGPWPETDEPITTPCGNYFTDGFRGRAPGGCYRETPSTMWLDSMIYPDRSYPHDDATADRLDIDSRRIAISVDMLTGRQNGPKD